jgi:uncharacterized membrane protein YbjE (DUF340 family)
MLSNKDYSQMQLDELVLEEKKLKSQRAIIAVFTGIIIGIAVWTATHKAGFYLTVVLLMFSFLIGSRHSKNLKGIQAEIIRRNTVL